jgi:YD repeat-containing protein
MQVKTLFARIFAVLCLFLLSPCAHAEGYYISFKCAYLSSGNCTGEYSNTRYTDLDTVLNAAGISSYYVCDKPARHEYESTSVANVGDSNGVTVKLPLVWTNCRDKNNPSYVVPGNDPGGVRGVLHTFEDTQWAITRCNPGYSPKQAGQWYPILCSLDIPSAVAADAANERGAPPNCDECSKSFIRQIAAGSEPVGPVVGDPINAANGNEMLEEEDYRSAGGNLLSFVRTYNSGYGFDDPSQAPGWTHSYLYRALVPTDGSGSKVVLQRPDGSSASFVLSQGAYIGPSYDNGVLLPVFTNNALTALRYVRPDGAVEEYVASGYYVGTLSKISFPWGGVLTFSYSGQQLTSVADGRGHSIVFTYGSVANYVRMTRVTLPDGTAVNYGYDTAGRLVTATYPGAAVRTYQYAEPAVVGGQLSPLRYKLTRVIAENGKPVVNVTYDSQGRATSSWAGTGNADLTTVSYGANSATVTEPLGAVAHMGFTSVGGTSRAFVTSNQRVCQNGCSGSDVFEYDGRGNVSGVVTKQGLKSCVAYSAPRNLPTLAVEGLPSNADCASALAAPPATARVRTYQWHASYAFPMSTTGPQQKVLFNYDTAGRLLMRAEIQTNDLTGAAGLSAQAVGTARTTTWTYNAKGSVTSVKAPRGDVNATTTYAYDSAENLVSVTDPVGLVTTYGSYDANGRPGVITYPNGLQSTLTYDARGRLTQVSTGGSTTSYGYDAAGLLVSATLPSGVSLTMGYDDAARLTWTQDSLGNRVDRTLDAAGNVIQETVKGNGGAIALSRQAAYDQLSRATSITKAF